MKVIDPGHEYLLDSLDGELVQRLTFVKREGEKYPGNVGSHPGTTTQEVLRALIQRSEYVNGQIPCPETTLAIGLLQSALYLLESRAARCHGRILVADIGALASGASKCSDCGHVGCNGSCRKESSSASLLEACKLAAYEFDLTAKAPEPFNPVGFAKYSGLAKQMEEAVKRGR